MPTVTMLKEIYKAYIDEFEGLRRSGELGEGLFGLGRSASQEACHERFAKNVDSYFSTLDEASINGTQAAQLLDYVLFTPLEYRRRPELYWMLLAVQGFSIKLIDALSKDDAKNVAEKFSKRFPKWERLEPQDIILRELKRRATK